MKKAILINSELQTITEVEYNSIDDIQRLIGCRCFTVATYLDNEDAIYVDDEGLYTPQFFFEYKGAHQPFAGNGLVVGANDEGEGADVKISLEDVKKNVTFKTPLQVLNNLAAKDNDIKVSEVITEDFVKENEGKRFNIIFSEPVEVVISRMRQTVKVMHNVGFFIGGNGGIYYMDARSKRRGFSINHMPTHKILQMEEKIKKVHSPIENAKTILKKIHANVWDELKEEMQEVIDGKFNQDFEWHFKGKLKFVSIASKIPKHERQWAMKAIKDAFENKKEYRWSKTADAPQGRDLKINIEKGGDDKFRAFFSSEFPGCGNGHYYILLNPTTAIYYEAD